MNGTVWLNESMNWLSSCVGLSDSLLRLPGDDGELSDQRRNASNCRPSSGVKAVLILDGSECQ